MKEIDMTNVQEATDFERITPGGYIGAIYTAKDYPDKEYLYICIDIAEGEYKNYYKELAERADFWGLSLYRSYKDTAKSMFKKFYLDVERSNEGYAWNWDEKTLSDKKIGIILGEEEYIANDGSVKTRIKITKTCPVKDIRDGNFKIPEKKLLNTPAEKTKTVTGNEDFMKVMETENPFNA